MAHSWNRIDPNLTPSNIKNGVSIFGVDGTLSAWNGSDFWWSADEIHTTKTRHFRLADDFTNSSRVTWCFEDTNYIYFCWLIQSVDFSPLSCVGYYSVTRLDKVTLHKDVYETSFWWGNDWLTIIGFNSTDIVFCSTDLFRWNSFNTNTLTFAWMWVAPWLLQSVEQPANGYGTFTQLTTIFWWILHFTTERPPVTNVTGWNVLFGGDTYSCRSIVTRLDWSNTNSFTSRFAIVKS